MMLNSALRSSCFECNRCVFAMKMLMRMTMKKKMMIMMMTFDDGDCGDFWIDQHNILCNVYGE